MDPVARPGVTDGARADPAEMQALVEASPRHARYAEPVDRESAREKLAAGLEEGARKAKEESRQVDRVDAPAPSAPPGPAPTRPSQDAGGGLVRDVVSSPAFKDFMRTAAREIARGMFGSGRR